MFLFLLKRNEIPIRSFTQKRNFLSNTFLKIERSKRNELNVFLSSTVFFFKSRSILVYDLPVLFLILSFRIIKGKVLRSFAMIKIDNESVCEDDDVKLVI